MGFPSRRVQRLKELSQKVQGLRALFQEGPMTQGGPQISSVKPQGSGCTDPTPGLLALRGPSDEA